MEVVVAVLMLKLNRIDSALRLNALLGLVGPLVFILVSALGLVGIAETLPLHKVLLITLGVILVVLGTM